MLFFNVCKSYLICLSIVLAVLVKCGDGKATVVVHYLTNRYDASVSSTRFHLNVDLDTAHVRFQRAPPSIFVRNRYLVNTRRTLEGYYSGNTTFKITFKHTQGELLFHEESRYLTWDYNEKKFAESFYYSLPGTKTRTSTSWDFRLTSTCAPHYYEPHRCLTYCKPGRWQIRSCDNAGRATCKAGWKGTHCRKDIDECAENSNQCSSHSKRCLNTIGSYTCICEAGYKGHYCTEDVNECLQPSACAHGGTCTNTPGSYTCTCTPGWKGTRCRKDIDECAENSNPCRSHSKSCLNTFGSYTCICEAGYKGHDCTEDVNECLKPSACEHGGTCTNTPGSYTCTCTPGFTGPHCSEDIDECVTGSQPCNANTVCVNSFGSYDCICTAGLAGQKCEHDVNECLRKNPCKNGATCVNTFGSYRCTCPPHFGGPKCAMYTDLCTAMEQAVCQNGGTCTTSDGQIYCNCTSGFFGNRCEMMMPPSAQTGKDNLYQILIMLGVGALALVISLGLLMFYRKKKKGGTA